MSLPTFQIVFGCILIFGAATARLHVRGTKVHPKDFFYRAAFGVLGLVMLGFGLYTLLQNHR